MTIPKRPEPPIAGSSFDPFSWEEARTAHEHAVAKVAVEALKWRRLEGGDFVQEHAASGVDHHPGCNRCEALAAIEQSGWKPE